MSDEPVLNLSDELAECWLLGRTGHSQTALTRAKILFQRAREAEDIAATATSLTHMAWFCLRLGQTEIGLDAAIAAKRLWVRYGDQAGEARSGAICSRLLLETGLSEEAYDEAEQALALAETLDDPSLLAFVCDCRGMVQMYGRQPLLSEPLIERAIELTRDLDDPSSMAMFLLHMAYGQVTRAELYEQDGDIDAGKHWREVGLETNDEAIASAERAGDGWNLRTALCNGAEYLALLDRPDQAYAYLERWHSVPGEPGVRELVHYHYTLAELQTRTGSLDEALENGQQAVALADSTTNIDHQANAVRRLGDIHEAMGNFQTALALHKRYHVLYEMQLNEVVRRRAHMADIGMEHGRLRATAERLAEEAAHDGLTGLPNRRSFDDAFAALEGKEVALAILDLDHFKSVNDRYSHAVGDAVLRRTAELLGARRNSDLLVFRLGGEEFAILFPRHGLDYAATRCEAIRSDIAALAWRDVAEDLTVTTSIGVAVGPGGSALMASADRRLYQAKSMGRNCMVSSDPVEGELAEVG